MRGQPCFRSTGFTSLLGAAIPLEVAFGGSWPHPTLASPTGEAPGHPRCSLKKGHSPRCASGPETAAVVRGAGSKPPDQARLPRGKILS